MALLQAHSTSLEKSLGEIQDDEDFTDRSDLPRFWERMADWFRNGDPGPYITDCIDGLEDIMNGTEPDDTLPVLKLFLPQIVKRLLNRSDVQSVVKARVNDFFQKTIHLMLSLSKKYDIEIITKTLTPILNPDKNFYIKRFEENSDMRKICQGSKYTGLHRLPRDLSDYFPYNVHYFGTVGGFEAMAELLSPDRHNGCTQYKLLLEPLWMIRLYINFDFLKAYARDLKAMVFTGLLPCAASVVKEDIVDFKTASTWLQNILTEAWGEDWVTFAVQEFNMDFGAYCLHQEKLETRLKGLQWLSKTIAKTEKPQSGPGLAQLFGRREATTPKAYIPPETLLDFLESHNVVKRYFSITTSHVEIIKQGLPFLQFLATRHCLTKDQVDIIWDGSLGIHEHDKRIVYAALAELTDVLPLDFVDHLLSKISAISAKNLDAESVNLLYQITLRAIKADKFNGLEAFWKIIFLTENVETVVKSKAVQHLSEILISSSCESQRMTYIERCVKNLGEITSIVLLQKILEAVAKKKRNFNMIENLNKDFKLLDVFFNNLVKFKKDCIQKSEITTDIDSMVINEYSYIQHINIRLQFLDFVLANSTFVFTKERVDTLWDLFIAQALTSTEKEITFVWLAKKANLSEDNMFSFPAPLNQHIFQKILALDCSSLTQTGFDIFCQFFIGINLEKSKVRRVETADFTEQPLQYAACDNDLLGIPSIWTMALSSEDPYVSSLSMKTLISLYHNVDIGIPQSRSLKLRQEFIASAVQRLESLANNKTSPPATISLQMARCAAVMKNYIQEFDDSQRKKAAQEAEKKKSAKLATGWANCFLELDGKKYTADIRIEWTLGTWVNKIYDQTKYTIERTTPIKVILSDKELKDRSKTFAQYGVKEGDKGLTMIVKFEHPDDPLPLMLFNSLQIALAGVGLKQDGFYQIMDQIDDTFVEKPSAKNKSLSWLKSTTASVTLPYEKVENLATTILAHHFERFYSLLNQKSGSTNEDLACEVFDLLCLLPPGKSLLDIFISLAKQNSLSKWGNLFDTKNPFKMAYNLHIMEVLMIGGLPGAQNTSSEMALPSYWIHSFKSIGLLSHFIPILISLPTKTVANKKVLWKLLKTTSLLFDKLEGQKQLGELLKKLIEIVGSTTTEMRKKKVYPEDDSEIVVQAIGLLVKLLSVESTLLPAFIKHKGMKDWIVNIILKTPVPKIRGKAADSLTILSGLSTSDQSENPVLFFLSILMPYLTEMSKYGETSAEYFTFLENLFLAGHKSVKVSTYLDTLIKQVKDHPVVENSSEAGLQDIVLEGMFQLIKAIITKKPQLLPKCYNLVGELVSNCLFSVPTATQINSDTNLPKCKQQKTRDAAYTLLLHLAKNYPQNLRLILTMLTMQTDQIHLKNDYKYAPAGNEKGKFGYIGLVNQGCTCYMNSLVQQLYMTPAFRAAMLSLPVIHDKNSIVSQLQIMLGSLQESEKKYFDTLDFCKCCRIDGRPIELNAQADAWEFFNSLFDETETAITKHFDKKTAGFLREIYGGTLVNQFIGAAENCNHKREREESFFTISLEIKDKSDLDEALQLFIKGEIVSDVHCAECNTNVNTLKRCVVQDLPPTLMLHLKRFDFDYQTMTKNKLNSACSFPKVLNMEPYTKQGILRKEGEEPPSGMQMHPSNYFLYDLVGVVVHSGDIDHGHYYSYIKERSPLKGDVPKWFEFNDKQVLPFDDTKLEAECFGGSVMRKTWNPATHSHEIREREKHHNAYILVYQRKGEEIQEIMGRPNAERTKKKRHKRTHSDGQIEHQTKEQQRKDNNSLRRSQSKNDLRTLSKALRQESSSDTSLRLPEEKGSLKSERSEEDTPRPKSKSKSKHDKRSHRSSRTKLKPEEQSNQTDATHTESHEDTQETEGESRGKPSTSSSATPRAVIEAPIEPSTPPSIRGPVLSESSDSDESGGTKEPPPSFQIDPAVERSLPTTPYLEEFKRQLGLTTRKSSKTKMATPRKVSNTLQQGKVFCPPALLHIITGQNLEFLLFKYLFSPEYHLFVWELLNIEFDQKPTEDYDSELHLIQFATKFYDQVYSHAASKPMHIQWTSKLKQFYSKNLKASQWLLSSFCSKPDLLKSLLVKCPDADVRSTFGQILQQAIICLGSIESPLYVQTAKKIHNKEPLGPEDSYVLRFADKTLERTQKTSFIHSKQFELFLPLSAFAACGKEAIAYLTERKILQTIRSVVVVSERSFYPHLSASVQNSSNSRFGPLLEVFATIICSSNPIPLRKAPADTSIPPTALYPASQLFDLSESDFDVIKDQKQIFMMKLVSCEVNPTSIEKMVVHTSWENTDYTIFWLQLVADGVSSASSFEDFSPFLGIFDSLSFIEDSQQAWRMNKSVKTFEKFLKFFQLHKPHISLRKCGEHLSTMCERNSAFREQTKPYQARLAKHLGYNWTVNN